MHALTGGNPFFVSEVLRGESDQLPASARDAVLARAARLSAAGRDVLDAAALVGERVEPDLLAAVTGADAASLDEPVGAGLLVADDTGLRFRHEIARRAVEQEVGPRTAAEVHRRILAELETSGIDDDARLAHHAEGALDAAATVRHARRAGDRSAELSSRREAATQYRRALRFVGTDQPLVRAELLDAMGRELATLDQWAAAAEVLEESIELWRAEGAPLREGDALRRLSVAYYRLCRGPEVMVAVRSALEVLEPFGPSRELAWALSRMAGEYMGNEMPEECTSTPAAPSRWQTPSACTTSPATRATPSRASSTTAATGGTPGSARRRPRPEHGLPDPAGRAYANLQDMLMDAMRYPEAERFYREGQVYCDDHDLATSGLCLAGGQAKRAHAHRPLGRGRGDLGGSAER